MKTLYHATALLLLALTPPLTHVQTGSTPRTADAEVKVPAYDVVSIKQDKSGSGSVSIDVSKDVYLATNVRLKTLLQNAYGIREDLISGVPEPINSARFDVEAKIVQPDLDQLKKLTPEQRRSMLLPFLADRFQLKERTEIKTLPVYDLVVMKSGSMLKQSTGHSGKRGCGTSVHNDVFTATGCPMATIARSLSYQVQRTVIDKTGLTGNYDLTLKWSPDEGSSSETDSSPSIFTAVQEQLGLKLRPAKGPVETLVVDHFSMPSEN